jgi:hypothetical protein
MTAGRSVGGRPAALDSLDATRVAAVIARIGEADQALAEALAQRAGRFEYTIIMQALQQAPAAAAKAGAASRGAP